LQTQENELPNIQIRHRRDVSGDNYFHEPAA
jgi:hypothetical protein